MNFDTCVSTLQLRLTILSWIWLAMLHLSSGTSTSSTSTTSTASQPYITFPPLADNKVKVTLNISGSSSSEVVIVQFDETSNDSVLTGWRLIALIAGSSCLFILLLSVCICLCHRRRKSERRKKVRQDPAEANLNVEGTEDGVYLRRMDSTSAKQYLHNMVCSVYSWGSDFDVSPEGATAAAHQNGDACGRGVSMHLYDNLETLNQARGSSAAPPPRPPKKGHSPGGHYLNVTEQLRRQR